MRILFFRGKFSRDGETFYNGLICWCHFHPDDQEKTILNAVTQIKSRVKVESKTKCEDVILVPFCLDDRSMTMNYDDAVVWFNKLAKKLKEPIVVPFSTSREQLNLSLLSGDAFTKLIEIRT